MNKKRNISNLHKFILPKGQTYLAELFYENIKINKRDLKTKEETNDFVKNLLIHQENKLTSYLTKQTYNSTKDFGTLPKYKLSKRIKKEALGLVKIINDRRSIREFSGENISLIELSTLLQAAKASNINDKNCGIKLRNIPSAGALYPLEIYFTLLKGIDSTISKGIYHYNAHKHYITCINHKPNVEKIESFLAQPEINVHKCAAIFYITGALEKVCWKYSNRGFCYMLLEAGHLAQNLLLISTSLNLAVCTLGGFVDDEVSDYLDIEQKEKTLYILVLGKQ